MPEGYQRLSTQDSSFIYFEGPGTHMHVSAVATPSGGAGHGREVAHPVPPADAFLRVSCRSVDAKRAQVAEV